MNSNQESAVPLPDLLSNWLKRTQVSGLDIVAVATHKLPQAGSLDFIDVSTMSASIFSQRPKRTSALLASLNESKVPLEEESSSDTKVESTLDDLNSTLRQAWKSHIEIISNDQPLKVQRIDELVLISCLVTQSSEGIACIGCVVAPPFNDHMLDTLQLSLGWLFFGFIRSQFDEGERAKRLLEITSDVLSQSDAQSAAQEWVNLTKQWATDLGDDGLGFSLFKVKNYSPKWWVSANVSWAVKGSPMMQAALELASIAITECQVQQNKLWWAYPMHYRGHVSAVLVVQQSDHADPMNENLKTMLQANADFIEPVFRRWQQSEQNLVAHSYRTSSGLLEKLVGKGYLAYKFLGFILILSILAVTLIPVEKIINAPLYLEGEQRYTITTPQQGYITEVLARPGDTVRVGQTLAKLEDKDLKIETAELASQLEQAEGQFRQSMAALDAAASGLAVNQKQQVQSKLDLVNEKIARTSIKSPISGVVVSGDWQQKVGTPVEVGSELFQVADVSSYRVIMHIPDKDMSELKVGQTGKMKLTSLPEQTYEFTVTRLTAVAEVKDGENGFVVEARLNKTPIQINPGMQGVGKVIVGETNLISSWTKSLIDWIRLKAWSIW